METKKLNLDELQIIEGGDAILCALSSIAYYCLGLEIGRLGMKLFC